MPLGLFSSGWTVIKADRGRSFSPEEWLQRSTAHSSRCPLPGALLRWCCRVRWPGRSPQRGRLGELTTCHTQKRCARPCLQCRDNTDSPSWQPFLSCAGRLWSTRVPKEVTKYPTSPCCRSTYGRMSGKSLKVQCPLDLASHSRCQLSRLRSRSSLAAVSLPTSGLQRYIAYLSLARWWMGITPGQELRTNRKLIPNNFILDYYYFFNVIVYFWINNHQTVMCNLAP
jgi:hypothetical protein